MARYIELDKAIEQFCSYGSVFTYGDNVCKAIVSRLKQVPTADVVKVVQCKDCKYYKRSKVDPNRKMCWRKDVDGFLVCYDFYPTDYCSYGERRK